MARIRSIKPDFFLHEGLAELSPLHRLFFIGLWTLADKSGRLEDRPKRIKAAVMPWENCDIEALLCDLDKAGFICRYEADGVKCIAIPGFERHQRAHPKEAESTLPVPPSREITRPAGKRLEGFAAGSVCIPSATAGKEILDHGNGKGRDPAPSFFASPTPTQPNPPVNDKPKSPTSGNSSARPFPDSLREQMEAAWLEKIGVPYAWGFEDDQAMRVLLQKGTDAEILKRWRKAIVWKEYPTCSNLKALAKHWNDYAKPLPGAEKSQVRL
jgi:hypothetical protein